MMFTGRNICRAAIVIVATMLAVSAFSQCIPTDKQTAWGGHSPVRLKESRPMSVIHGIAQDMGGVPLGEVLVEIYDHPEILERDPTPTRTGQKRIAGCLTDVKGTFSLRVPSGHYEVRFSKAADWEVTSVVVVVAGNAISKKGIIVKLVPGT